MGSIGVLSPNRVGALEWELVVSESRAEPGL